MGYVMEKWKGKEKKKGRLIKSEGVGDKMERKMKRRKSGS